MTTCRPTIDLLASALRSNELPIIVLTGDQDWAPEWAMQSTVRLCIDHDVPYHLFRTNQSDLYDRAVESDSRFSNGWHPNFLPNSTHGGCVAEVIREMVRIAPESRSVRCHSFFEYSDIWRALRATQIVAESNALTAQGLGLAPVRMWSGLVRFPVFCEDDHFFSEAITRDRIKRLKMRLRTSGLKIFNFHPIHLALNTPGHRFYNDWKSGERNRAEQKSFDGLGTTELFREIIAYSRESDFPIASFEDLISAASEVLGGEADAL